MAAASVANTQQRCAIVRAVRHVSHAPRPVRSRYFVSQDVLTKHTNSKVHRRRYVSASVPAFNEAQKGACP